MRNALGLLPLVIGVAACSDATGLDPDDLAGTWVANLWAFTNPADPTETMNALALGGSFRLVLNADGTFTSTIQEPGDDVADVDSGTYEVVGNVITIAESGQGSPTAFAAERDGDTMVLTTSDEEIDWDGDGQDDPATMQVVLTRQ